ncbi:hypothetical protein RDABS01_021057 [Bienertia sinuspersici]
MADEEQNPQNEDTQEDQLDYSSEYPSDSDSDSDEENNDQQKLTNEELYYRRAGEFEDIPKEDRSEEANIERFNRVFESRRYKRKLEEEERKIEYIEDMYDFPYDRENWREEDIKELWSDAPFGMNKPGWDPAFATKQDWRIIENEFEEGHDLPIAPFYLPYRKCYPAIPDNHHDISNPKAVIEELDRIEEFLRWVSYVFADGSSYEGEWLQNNMEGHGVVEVEIPDVEPIPGSKLESQMRAEGKIIKRDYMSAEDRKWLEMDIEDSVRKKVDIVMLVNGSMEECMVVGRFYFGELLNEIAGCTPEISTMHAGIAEVAAAKARMFINKPDGMVREERGPYSDPQHPYFYEEEDVWQAPGFINQFHEVPDYWKTYVNEVDQEREMWLNSFYKAPLRLPMPAELEHWWENERPPQFVLLNKEPEPDPNDPSKLIYTEDPVILHTPTGRIINYIEDEEHGVRLFWQPTPSESEDVDPTKVKFLPLGFDEFYGRGTAEKKEGFLKRLVCSIENACKPWFEKLEKWTEEQKKESELRMQLLEQELELVEAELSLEEALEDMEEALKQQEKEAENKAEVDAEEEDVSASPVSAGQTEKVSSKDEIRGEDEDEEDEEEEDDGAGAGLAPSSFGSVADPKDKKNGPGKSPFSTLSLASSLLSTVPSMVEKSFSVLKKRRYPLKVPQASCSSTDSCMESTHLITFCQSFPENMSLRVKAHQKIQVKRGRSLLTSFQTSNRQSSFFKNQGKGHRSWEFNWLSAQPERNSDMILSLQIPIESLELCLR